MVETKKRDEIEITLELIDEFLEELEKKGRSAICIQSYRTSLVQMYRWLPEDKQLHENEVKEWRKWLEEQKYSHRTINVRMSAMNHFLQYIGRKGWRLENYFPSEKDVQPELTRGEYKRLLQAAKQLNKEKAYLLIKMMEGAGLRIQELSQITVEGIRAGTVLLKNRSGNRMLRIPKDLKKELLSYAGREGIVSGPLFVTHEGASLNRSSVWQCIKSVSRDARVTEEKATPRCLWKMYQTTYADIQANITSLVEQAYEHMMEEEQLIVGWEV